MGAMRLRHSFKITQGLEQGDFQTRVTDSACYIRSAFIINRKIIFKNFDPVKTGVCNSFKLLDKVAAD